MITNIKFLKRYCKNYTKIENYEEALKSPIKYDLHHCREISEMQSVSDLKFLHLYYNRPPEELIFLEHGEHIRLHNANRSEEARQKISEAQKGKQNALGHHWNLSAETRKRMSNAKKNMSAETKQKISEARKGKHWTTENGHRIWTE